MARLVSKETAWKTLLALMFLGLLSASPLSAQSLVFYVDAVNGDDDANDDGLDDRTTALRHAVRARR